MLLDNNLYKVSLHCEFSSCRIELLSSGRTVKKRLLLIFSLALPLLVISTLSCPRGKGDFYLVMYSLSRSSLLVSLSFFLNSKPSRLPPHLLSPSLLLHFSYPLPFPSLPFLLESVMLVNIRLLLFFITSNSL